MKHCAKCKTYKPFSEFQRNKARKSGYEVYCKMCKSIVDKAYVQLIREEALNAYGGPTCANCGETFYEVLAIDHIHNDGAEDRKRRGRGNSFFAALKREGWPSGLQVLCLSCNFLKQWYPEKLEEFKNCRRVE